MTNLIRWGLIALGILFVLGIVALNAPQWYTAWRADRESLRQVVYVIPPGTSQRLHSGEPLSVLPNQVNLVLGQKDTLIIRNQDTEPIEIGGLKIAVGQQFRQQFTDVGVYDLVCSVHPINQIRIVVKAR